MKKIIFGGVTRAVAPGIALLFASAAQAAINISTQPTQNMSCSGGVCTATAQKAYLNVNEVTNYLAAGDLKIVSGAGAEDIHIQAPFSWTSTSRLTLDAQRSIEFEEPVSVAGTGALTLITNDGGTGGDYWFDEGASVTFWDTSSSLIINGQSFTLVKDIKTLASDIAAKPSGNFALASSYDASKDGTYGETPVTTQFLGVFEGCGNSIKNFSVTSGVANSRVSLFAYSAGVLRDLQLTNIAVSGTSTDKKMGQAVGGLAAVNEGTISRITVSGSASALSRGVALGDSSPPMRPMVPSPSQLPLSKLVVIPMLPEDSRGPTTDPSSCRPVPDQSQTATLWGAWLGITTKAISSSPSRPAR